MFGLRRRDVISQCPVRKEEIAHEQKRTTDCISMSLERETAWVHLTLGLSQAAIDIILNLTFYLWIWMSNEIGQKWAVKMGSKMWIVDHVHHRWRKKRLTA